MSRRAADGHTRASSGRTTSKLRRTAVVAVDGRARRRHRRRGGLFARARRRRPSRPRAGPACSRPCRSRSMPRRRTPWRTMQTTESCASAVSCAAAGSYVDAGGNTHGLLDVARREVRGRPSRHRSRPMPRANPDPVLLRHRLPGERFVRRRGRVHEQQRRQAPGGPDRDPDRRACGTRTRGARCPATRPGDEFGHVAQVRVVPQRRGTAPPSGPTRPAPVTSSGSIDTLVGRAVDRPGRPAGSDAGPRRRSSSPACRARPPARAPPTGSYATNASGTAPRSADRGRRHLDGVDAPAAERRRDRAQRGGVRQPVRGERRPEPLVRRRGLRGGRASTERWRAARPASSTTSPGRPGRRRRRRCPPNAGPGARGGRAARRRRAASTALRGRAASYRDTASRFRSLMETVPPTGAVTGTEGPQPADAATGTNVGRRPHRRVLPLVDRLHGRRPLRQQHQFEQTVGLIDTLSRHHLERAGRSGAGQRCHRGRARSRTG